MAAPFLLIIGFLNAYLLTWYFAEDHEFGFYRRILKNKLVKRVKLFGVYLHHSLLGVLLLILFFIINSYLVLGAGFGIIFRHSIAEKKIRFIGKE